MTRISSGYAALLCTALLALIGGCGERAERPTGASGGDPAGTLADAAPARPDAYGDLRVSDARLRMPVAGQDKTAGYLTLENLGDAPLTLVGAESPSARSIEFHASERDGDMVRMRRREHLVVPPGAQLRLEPGGLHLMLFGVTSLDEPFMITLHGASGERLDLPFRITAPGAE